MLLKSYKIKIFNNECMPGAMSVQCFAELDQDISQALPYLNASLGGFEYIKDPPSVTFRAQGKLITVHGRKIAINALKDEIEAKRIIEWIKHEINQVWEKRDHIEPSYEGMPKINIIDILKFLPKTNCRKCGAATCMVFAVQLTEGAKGPENCPYLAKDIKQRLNSYLKQYQLDI